MRCVMKARNCLRTSIQYTAENAQRTTELRQKNARFCLMFAIARDCTRCGNFGCNTLMYKQVARVLPVLALLPAPAFGQVTFSKDVAPVVFTQVRPVPPSWRIGTVQSADVRRARDRTRRRSRSSRRIASCRRGKSDPAGAQVHRIGSADRRRDRNPSALGRGRRARRQSTRPAHTSDAGAAAGSSAHPISSSRCRRRSCFRPTARTSRACSCCRSPSIDSATCAASSSAPTTRGFITRTSASTPRRRRASSTSRTRRPATTASSCVRRSIPTGISSDGRRARPLPFCPRGSRGRSRREAISSCSCTSCPAESRS